MKTLKITEDTHNKLIKIKAFHGYATLDEVISICIDALFTIDPLPKDLYVEIKNKRNK